MAADILEKILARKRIELAESKQWLPYSNLERLALEVPAKPSFHKALTGKETISVIAEVKQASPSKGIIATSFDPLATARGYIDAGADAISVLTEREFFHGHPEFLRSITSFSPIPCLRKDFLFDEYQILEARLWGASAFLLIVDCLDKPTLRTLREFGEQLGLDALVEAHTADEVKAALDSGARIVGVNNRNLRTFEVDLSTSLALRPLVPAGIPFVSESGISSPAEVQTLREHGADAVLVGEAFMRGGAQLITELRNG